MSTNTNEELGIDTIEAQIKISLMKKAELATSGKIELFNDEGIKYGSIQIKNKNTKNEISAYADVSLNLPKLAKQKNNVMPYGIVESLDYKNIGMDIEKVIKKILKINRDEEYVSNVTRVEVNVTTEVDSETTCDILTELFLQAYSNKLTKQEKGFMHGEKDKKYNTTNRTNNGFFSRKLKTIDGGEYYLKVYDKDYEQWCKNAKKKGALLKDGNKRKIRIEIVMEKSLLKTIFDPKELTIDNIIKPKSVKVLCNEYKRILEEEIMAKNITPYIKNTVNDCLVPHLLEYGSYVKTYTEFKVKIVDSLIIKNALYKYYEIQKSAGHLKSNAKVSVYVSKAMKYLRDNHHIEEFNGTLKTIEKIIQKP